MSKINKNNIIKLRCLKNQFHIARRADLFIHHICGGEKLRVKSMKKIFVIHYSEIGLKGRNRKLFEDRLILNIREGLGCENFDFVKKISGRLILKLNEKSDVDAIREKLKKVFGIAYFCESWESSQDLEILQKDLLELMKNRVSRRFERNEESHSREIPRLAPLARDDTFSVTFKIDTQRSNKNYSLTSQQVNKKIGEYILENFKGRKIKVNLTNPVLTCFIEIVEKYAFIYFEKIKGAGGLPSRTSGKIVSLISSGFDSPVASYLLMRRGAEIIFIHFESTPQTSVASIENVKNLIRKLTRYQLESKLYLIPFLEIQKEIIRNCKLDLVVILYRRMMVYIVCEIAKKERAKAIVTGENLGQVASQTLENIEVINQASNLPIFRPLIGFDKEEIINFAKKISAYEISSQPYEDCCSLFVPRHPQTRAKLEEVEKEERKLDIKKMVKTALQRTKTEEFSL